MTRADQIRAILLAKADALLDVTLFTGFGVATMIVNDGFAAGGAEVSGRYKSLCVFSGGRWLAGQTAKAG